MGVLADNFLKLPDTRDIFGDLDLTNAKVKYLCKMKLECTHTEYVKRVRHHRGEDELKKELEAWAANNRKSTR